MKLSIVIATYNRAQSLLTTLRSLSEQEGPYSDWECIVVDNNCTDDTQSVVAAFAADNTDMNLHIVVETRQGLSHARNRGIAECSGDYVAIIDDDETVNRGFAQAYIALFDGHPEWSVAGGGVVACYPSGRPSWLSPLTERPIANPIDFGRSIRPFPKGRIPAGGNMAFRREALLKYRGFEPSLGRTGKALTGGEENDLFERMAADGIRFAYVPDAVINHIIGAEKLTPDYFKRLSRGTGESQLRRAVLHGRRPNLYIAEAVKWCATLAIALWYTLTLHPQRGLWLIKMRIGISRGIFFTKKR